MAGKKKKDADVDFDFAEGIVFAEEIKPILLTKKDLDAKFKPDMWAEKSQYCNSFAQLNDINFLGFSAIDNEPMFA